MKGVPVFVSVTALLSVLFGFIFVLCVRVGAIRDSSCEGFCKEVGGNRRRHRIKRDQPLPAPKSCFFRNGALHGHSRRRCRRYGLLLLCCCASIGCKQWVDFVVDLQQQRLKNRTNRVRCGSRHYTLRELEGVRSPAYFETVALHGYGRQRCRRYGLVGLCWWLGSPLFGKISPATAAAYDIFAPAAGLSLPTHTYMPALEVSSVDIGRGSHSVERLFDDLGDFVCEDITGGIPCA